MHFHYDLLSGLAFFPVIGMVILLAWRRLEKEWAFRIALAAGVAPWAFVIKILSLHRSSVPGYQFESQWPLGLSLTGDVHTGLDGFSIGLLVLVSLLVPLSIRAAWRNPDLRTPSATRLHLALLLLSQTALYGILSTLNLLHGFIFWEVLMAAIFVLLQRPGQERTNLAARQFLIFAVGGSVLALAGLLYLHKATGSWDLPTLIALARKSSGAGAPSILVIYLQETAVRIGLPALSKSIVPLVFGLIAGGLLIQAPVWPFHGWLPAAAARSPVSAVILLVGLAPRMSIYLFLRLILPLFGNRVAEYHGLLLGCVAITIATAAVAALVQENPRKLAAYASLVGNGFCLLGIVAAVLPGVPAQDRALALNGVLVQAFAQGMILAGWIYFLGRGDPEVSDEELRFPGRWRNLDAGLRRSLGVILLVGLGLPGFAGFIGPLMIFRGSVSPAMDAAIVALLGLMLTGIAAFRMASCWLLEPQDSSTGTPFRVRWYEKAAVLMVLFVLLLVGLFPGELIRLANATVIRILGGS
jgi:NADH-quinone oxidoreductase subunit M